MDPRIQFLRDLMAEAERRCQSGALPFCFVGMVVADATGWTEKVIFARDSSGVGPATARAWTEAMKKLDELLGSVNPENGSVKGS